LRLRNPDSRFKPEWPQGCWPSPDQLLLLRACLLDDDLQAQRAFTQWSERTDLFFVEDGLSSLLMLLPERLARWQIKYADYDRLHGIVRYHWVRHQMFLRDLWIVTSQLQKAGVDILLLKGAALNIRTYPKSNRLMSDLDIAVPRIQINKAVAALTAGGWSSMFRNIDNLPFVTHGCHFKRGETELDLHWDFFHGRPLTEEQQDRMWSECITEIINGMKVRILSPDLQILHTCEHGLRYNETPPLRWIADTFFILKNAGEIDWRRLRSHAAEFGLIKPVIRTLEYLQSKLDVSLPAGAVQMLRDAKVPPMARLEFAVATRRMPGAHPFWRELPEQILDFRRARKLQAQLALGTYLAVTNNLDGSFSSNFRKLSRIQTTAIKDGLISGARRAISIFKRSSPTNISIFSSERWRGWFPPESTDFGALRWSSSRASIQFAVKAEHKKIMLTLAPVRPWSGDLDGCLFFRFNRHAIERQQVRFDNWTVTIDLSTDMFATAPLQRLEVRCDPWKIPDPRELGIPVKRISIIPG
jgi:Uncharacterised nucleotidyltransferase